MTNTANTTTSASTKIAAALSAAAGWFGSASLLRRAIAACGVPTESGKFFLDDDGWRFSPLDGQRAYSRAESGWADPEFFVQVDQVLALLTVQVGFGRHWADISFDVTSGDVVAVTTDDLPSEACWETGDRAAALLGAIRREKAATPRIN